MLGHVDVGPGDEERAMADITPWAALVPFGTFHHLGGAGPACGGCGQVPRDFRLYDALGMVRLIGRRCEELLRLPEALLQRSAPRGPRKTALELTDQAVCTLDRTAQALGALPGVDADGVPAEETDRRQDEGRRCDPRALRVSVGHRTADLLHAIGSIPPHEWNHVRSGTGTTTADTVWLALHEVTHSLEDAELAMRAMWAN
jgi:hypothetical protein